MTRTVPVFRGICRFDGPRRLEPARDRVDGIITMPRIVIRAVD